MTLQEIENLLAKARKNHALLHPDKPLDEEEIMLVVPRPPSWRWGSKTHVTVPGIGKGRIQSDIIPGGGTGCLAWFTYGRIEAALAAAQPPSRGDGSARARGGAG